MRQQHEAVCTRCNDTHEMPARDSYGYETGGTWMCTGCPVPCRECGKGGPFCLKTPCPCSCHAKARAGTGVL